MLVKSDEKPVNISCDFQDWTLDDPNPGRREFFATVMDAMENNESGFATFSVGVPMEEGVGGYFTNVLNLDSVLSISPSINSMNGPDWACAVLCVIAS